MSKGFKVPLVEPTEPGTYLLNGKEVTVLKMDDKLLVKYKGKMQETKDLKVLWSKIVGVNKDV